MADAKALGIKDFAAKVNKLCSPLTELAFQARITKTSDKMDKETWRAIQKEVTGQCKSANKLLATPNPSDYGELHSESEAYLKKIGEALTEQRNDKSLFTDLDKLKSVGISIMKERMDTRNVADTLRLETKKFFEKKNPNNYDIKQFQKVLVKAAKSNAQIAQHTADLVKQLQGVINTAAPAAGGYRKTRKRRRPRHRKQSRRR
jgi:hypothetical protein